MLLRQKVSIIVRIINEACPPEIGHYITWNGCGDVSECSVVTVQEPPRERSGRCCIVLPVLVPMLSIIKYGYHRACISEH
jgi:hypothetical protein